MKKILLLILSVVVADLLFQQCANPMTPTGGPKDTIPPTLLKAYPENGTIDFKEQTITLDFDEFINADKLTQNLVITPKTKIKYKHQIKRMQLTLKFEEPFNDSTTYSLNFFDGVTDITERNPVVNLTLAFSTGSYIDSMKVSGEVSDLYTQEMMEGYTVGLYPLTDTLDFLTDDPIYFTTTNSDGFFEINYIKSGKYKIISFDDDNRNLLLDPETEANGFIADTIDLSTYDSSYYQIRTQLLNVKPIKFINARPVAQYIEAKYSREIDSFNITPDSTFSFIIGDKKDVIRIYNKDQYTFGDSIQFILNTSDSLGNNTIDTIKSVFLESNRKLPSFSASILNKANQLLKPDHRIRVQLNKPIDRIDTSIFYFKKDSTFLFPIEPKLEWNQNRNELDIITKFNIDSLLLELEKSLPKDTTQIDSLKLLAPQKPDNEKTPTNIPIQFEIGKGAFISIENDTSKTLNVALKTYEKPSFGSLNINLTTDFTSFTLQLLSKGNVTHESSNQKYISFPKVKPGTYKIRVLIDDNNDGIWSNGNILKGLEPETIFIYPEETSIRENWVVDLDISLE